MVEDLFHHGRIAWVLGLRVYVWPDEAEEGGEKRESVRLVCCFDP
jgi:hypothetical protein